MSHFKDKVITNDSFQVCSGNNEEDAVVRLKISGAANAAAANVPSIVNASHGQATVYTLRDAGVAAADILTSAGRQQASTSTIAGVAGATNVCTVTVQIKDAAGTNIAKVVPFEVYSSSAADGLTLATAASTGYSVVSGGIKRAASSTTITQGIAMLSSATGGAVLSLTDTGKQAIYLVLLLDNGIKISTVLTSGSYG